MPSSKDAYSYHCVRSIITSPRDSEMSAIDAEAYWYADEDNLSRPLSGLLTVNVNLDDAAWHYVIVFPQVSDPSASKWLETLPDALEQMGRIFSAKACNALHLEQQICNGMTRLRFHEAIRQGIIDLLSGPKCGFKLESMLSSDLDERYLLIELASLEARKAIANRFEMRIPVRVESYPQQAPCPTTSYHGGQFTGTDYCPLHHRFDKRAAHVYQPFSEIEILRLCIRRIGEFVNLEELFASGVALQIFPVHRWHALEELADQGWSSLWPRWPGDESIEQIRAYFGEEVAFFFHWFDFFSEALVPLAVLSLIIRTCIFFIGNIADVAQGTKSQYLLITLAAAICIWSSIFSPLYNQRCSLKIEQWGMRHYHRVAAVLDTFREELRGTWLEHLRSQLMGILSASVMMETVVVVYFVLEETCWFSGHIERFHFLGVRGGDYLIMTNIKVIDLAWSAICPWLTERENWRTRQERKTAVINRLFTVKFVVYFYPFLYTAFVKKYVNGCPQGDCIPELQMKLFAFLISHVVYALLFDLGPMAYTCISIRASGTSRKNQTYSFVQLQSKYVSYSKYGEVDDILDLVIMLGFVMMFSAVFPWLAPVILTLNLFEIRLLAFRISHFTQRPMPTGQEGMKQWEVIIDFIARVSIMCNAGLIAFMLPPLSKARTMHQLVAFVILEHATLLLRGMSTNIISSELLVLSVIQERNEELVDEVLTGTWEHSGIHVEQTTKPNMAIVSNAFACRENSV